MKRSGPLKRTGGLKRSGPIKARARARKVDRDAGELPAREWHALVLARAGGRCEAQLVDCTGRATDAHHRYRPGRPNTPANGVALCASCHTGSARAVHRNEAWAVEVGLLVKSSAGGPPAERWAWPEESAGHPRSG